MENVIRFPVRPVTPPSEPEPLWREVVGAQLLDARRDRDQRLVDVAARAGVSPQYLSELERGRKDASSEVLAAVSGALGLSMQELTTRVASRLRGTGGGRGVSGPVCLAA